MSNLINSFWDFGGAPPVPPNLLIGGVSATISTAAILATYFDFIESEVDDFTIDGDDISAVITNTSYLANASAFSTNTDITFFTENAGYLEEISNQMFKACTSLISVECTGATQTNGLAFSQCSILQAEDILLPNLTLLLGATNFQLMDPLDRSTLSLPSCTEINNGKENFKSSNFDIDLPELITATVTPFRNFGYWGVSGSTLNVPKLNPFGVDALENLHFRNMNTSGIIINTHADNETNNGGAPDGDIAYALARSATVNYI